MRCAGDHSACSATLPRSLPCDQGQPTGPGRLDAPGFPCGPDGPTTCLIGPGGPDALTLLHRGYPADHASTSTNDHGHERWAIILEQEAPAGGERTELVGVRSALTGLPWTLSCAWSQIFSPSFPFGGFCASKGHSNSTMTGTFRLKASDLSAGRSLILSYATSSMAISFRLRSGSFSTTL